MSDSVIMTAVVMALCIGLAAGLMNQGQDSTREAPSEVPGGGSAKVTYSSHAPISIVGNSGFAGPNATTGVVSGDGSESDPYLISGWDIDASTANGIHVKDSDAYFLISDCYIHDGILYSHAGIYLDNCTHGVIRNNTCVRDWDGIYLKSSRNLTACDNNCSYDDGGVILSRSVGIILTGNTMWGNGISIAGDTLSECNTHDIDTSNTVNGKPIRYYKDQTGVTVPEPSGQIILANCTDSVIEGHCISDATVAVSLRFSSNSTIRNNTFSNSVYGISLWYSDGNTLINNTCRNDAFSDYWWGGILLIASGNNFIAENNCSDSSYGIQLMQSSNNNTIIGNSITRNLIGIYAHSSNHNAITRNAIYNNSQYGAAVFFCIGNSVWNNTFINNNGAVDTYDASHIQAFEVGMANIWNSSDGDGNYWGDWTTPDTLPPYGRVDVPYEVDGSSDAKDYYPQTQMPVQPIPEFGSASLGFVLLVVAAILALSNRSRRAKWP